MGWTGGDWACKADVVAEILAGYAAAGSEVVASKSVRQGLWVLVSDRIDFYPIDGKSGSYAHKGMSETEGPYYYDVPVEWLDRAPEANAAWRQKVRAHAAAKGRTWNPGDRVYVHGHQYKVVEPAPKGRQCWHVELLTGRNAGQIYRAKGSDMRLADDVEREAREYREKCLASPYRVTSAFGDWHENVPAGMVGVLATPGGNRDGIGTERAVLVPVQDYRLGYELTGSEASWCGPYAAKAHA